MMKSALAASLLSIALLSPAKALTIDFATIKGDTLTTAQASAFQRAATAWSSVLTDDVTMSLSIGFRSLGSNILGATSSTLVSTNAADLTYGLALDAKTATDLSAVTSLIGSTGSKDIVLLTSAEAKAIGFALPSGLGSDGTIEFSSDFAFSTSRRPDGTIASGTYDLIGIAEHEIAHALGFISGVDYPYGLPTVLDEFRYGASGVRSFGLGNQAYFSVDGGRTALASFSDGINDQASHWLSGTTSDGGLAVMNPEVGAGEVRNITPVDLAALDAIGWDATATSPVPLPASAPLFGAALVALAILGYGLNGREKARDRSVA